ncbi:hypothetical protein [Pararobbsia silviterrae]|uniref:DUF3617 family protein n=1 Tax=Pararobbsia silviterrae TaxID=1792498 RepID=A0A494Y6X7_9BURK|nr:hypothetical protein [Pararobbsia silviterrae]RKP57832.1 hypothetical protein D7S86_07880 [Pararobbsia silviterrae]
MSKPALTLMIAMLVMSSTYGQGVRAPVDSAASGADPVSGAHVSTSDADSVADTEHGQGAVPKAIGSKRVCVSAEVNGEIALSYDCLTQRLAPVRAASGDTPGTAEELATAPSNRVGTFSYSAESIRFGSAWGKSVEPQRPAPLVVVPPR